MHCFISFDRCLIVDLFDPKGYFFAFAPSPSSASSPSASTLLKSLWISKDVVLPYGMTRWQRCNLMQCVQFIQFEFGKERLFASDASSSSSTLKSGISSICEAKRRRRTRRILRLTWVDMTAAKSNQTACLQLSQGNGRCSWRHRSSWSKNLSTPASDFNRFSFRSSEGRGKQAAQECPAPRFSFTFK